MDINHTELDLSPESIPLRRSVWLIFFSAAAVLLLILGKNPLLGSEGGSAESIRLLLDGKDIFAVDRTFPPDSFIQLWLCRIQMLPALLLGNSEFSWRVFSMIPALLLLSGTMLLTDEIFGRRAMCCAGWMLIGSYGFIYWGRNAGNYIFLAAWSIWCAVLLYRKNFPFIVQTLFFFLVFSGSMWWGTHFIFALPGVIVAAYPRWKGNFFSRYTVFSALAGVAGALMISLLLLWHPGIAPVEYAVRFLHQLKCSFLESFAQTCYAPLSAFDYGRHLVNLPRLIFPWILPAGFTVYWMIRKYKELSAEHRFLLWGAAVMFLLTGVFPSRRWQFQLCQLPLFIMIASGGVTGKTVVGKYQDIMVMTMRWGAAVAGSFAVSVFVVFPLWDMIFNTSMPGWIMFAIPVLGLLALGALVFDTGGTSAVEKYSGMRGSWSGYILAWTCLCIAVFAIGIPALGEYRTGKPFWQKCGQLAEQAKPGKVIFFNDAPEAQALCYMDLSGRVYNAENEEGFLRESDGLKTALVILHCRDYPEFQKILENSGWKTGENGDVIHEEGHLYLFGNNSGKNIFSAYLIRKK